MHTNYDSIVSLLVTLRACKLKAELSVFSFIKFSLHMATSIVWSVGSFHGICSRYFIRHRFWRFEWDYFLSRSPYTFLNFCCLFIVLPVSLSLSLRHRNSYQGGQETFLYLFLTTVRNGSCRTSFTLKFCTLCWARLTLFCFSFYGSSDGFIFWKK